MVSYSVTFLLILRKLWVIVLFRVLHQNYGTIFLLKSGVPIILYKINLLKVLLAWLTIENKHCNYYYQYFKLWINKTQIILINLNSFT